VRYKSNKTTEEKRPIKVKNPNRVKNNNKIIIIPINDTYSYSENSITVDNFKIANNKLIEPKAIKPKFILSEEPIID